MTTPAAITMAMNIQCIRRTRWKSATRCLFPPMLSAYTNWGVTASAVAGKRGGTQPAGLRRHAAAAIRRGGPTAVANLRAAPQSGQCPRRQGQSSEIVETGEASPHSSPFGSLRPATRARRNCVGSLVAPRARLRSVAGATRRMTAVAGTSRPCASIPCEFVAPRSPRFAARGNSAPWGFANVGRRRLFRRQRLSAASVGLGAQHGADERPSLLWLHAFCDERGVEGMCQEGGAQALL